MGVLSVPSEEGQEKFEKDSQELEILYNAAKTSYSANSPAFLMMVAYILA